MDESDNTLDEVINSRDSELTAIADRLIRGLQRELHKYAPLVIAAIKRKVPQHNWPTAASDAVQFLDEAYEKWLAQRDIYVRKQFEAYAKICVNGKLHNAYVRSTHQPVARDPLDRAVALEWRQREQRSWDDLFRLLEPVVTNRPDLLKRIYAHNGQRDLRRILRQNRRISRLLPARERFVLYKRQLGATGANIAQELGRSAGRITQIQQHAVERLLEYLALILEGISTEELASRSAREEITSDPRSTLLKSDELELIISRTAKQIIQSQFIRWEGNPRRAIRGKRIDGHDRDGHYITAAYLFPDPFDPRYRPRIMRRWVPVDLYDSFSSDDSEHDNWERDRWERVENQDIIENYFYGNRGDIETN